MTERPDANDGSNDRRTGTLDPATWSVYGHKPPTVETTGGETFVVADGSANNFHDESKVTFSLTDGEDPATGTDKLVAVNVRKVATSDE